MLKKCLKPNNIWMVFLSISVAACTSNDENTTSTTVELSSITSTSATLGGNIALPDYTERGICYSTAPNPSTNDSKVAASGGGTGAFTVTLSGLTPNTTYHARAYAVNAKRTVYADGQSFTTLAVDAEQKPPDTPSATEPPAPPSGLTATASSTMLQVNLHWADNANNETGYKVEHSPDGNAWTELAVLPENTTSYQNTELLASTRYYYRISAFNELGDSGYSNAADATTRPAPSLTVPFMTNGEFSIAYAFDWPTATRPDDHFEIENSYYRDSGYEMLLRGDNGERRSPLTITNLFINAEAVGKTLYFRARVYSNGSYTAYSNPVSMIASNTSNAVYEVSTRNNVLLYSTINPEANNVSYPNEVLAGVVWYYSYVPLANMWSQYFASYSTALFFNVNSQISGKNVSKAELRLFVAATPLYKGPHYYVAAFSGPWGDNVTNETKPSTYSQGIVQKAPPEYLGPWVVDVTQIVRNWADGTWANNGFYLSHNDWVFPNVTEIRRATFYSRQNATHPAQQPALYIEFE
jgi:hypothetical protein